MMTGCFRLWWVVQGESTSTGARRSAGRWLHEAATSYVREAPGRCFLVRG